MRNVKPAIIVYVFSSILFMVSSLLKNENLTMFAKPIVSSSMIFYYFQEKKGTSNLWYLSVLLLLFLSGIFNLFDDKDALFYVLLLNLVAYTIILGLIIKNLFELNYKILDDINSTYIILMSLFLLCIFYVCLFLVFDSSHTLYRVMVVYGSTLLLVGILNTVLFIFNTSRANTFLMLTSFCFIICDSFYAIYYYYYDFIFLRIVSILSNIFSFYFIVNYFILKSRKDNWNGKNKVSI